MIHDHAPPNERRSLDDVILPMTMRATVSYGPMPAQPEPIDAPSPGMVAFPVMLSVLVPVDILCPDALPGPGAALADEVVPAGRHGIASPDVIPPRPIRGGMRGTDATAELQRAARSIADTFPTTLRALDVNPVAVLRPGPLPAAADDAGGLDEWPAAASASPGTAPGPIGNLALDKALSPGRVTGLDRVLGQAPRPARLLPSGRQARGRAGPAAGPAARRRQRVASDPGVSIRTPPGGASRGRAGGSGTACRRGARPHPDRHARRRCRRRGGPQDRAGRAPGARPRRDREGSGDGQAGR